MFCGEIKKKKKNIMDGCALSVAMIKLSCRYCGFLMEMSQQSNSIEYSQDVHFVVKIISN